MNRAQLAAVIQAAADLHTAARELLAAEANLANFEKLRQRIVPAALDAWAPIIAEVEQRAIDARWRYANNVAGLRRLTTKEPT